MVLFNPIPALLSNVHQRLLEHQAAILQSGEHFNIYEVLELTTREVQLHSRLLARLLHPAGSHRMGDVFLKEFISVLQEGNRGLFKDLSSFDTRTAVVEIEYPLGPIDLESIRGGKMPATSRINWSATITSEINPPSFI